VRAAASAQDFVPNRPHLFLQLHEQCTDGSHRSPAPARGKFCTATLFGFLPHRKNICMWVMPCRITWICSQGRKQFYTATLFVSCRIAQERLHFSIAAFWQRTVGQNRSTAGARRQFYTATLFASCRIAQEIFGTETAYCRAFQKY